MRWCRPRGVYVDVCCWLGGFPFLDVSLWWRGVRRWGVGAWLAPPAWFAPSATFAPPCRPHPSRRYQKPITPVRTICQNRCFIRTALIDEPRFFRQATSVACVDPAPFTLPASFPPTESSLTHIIYKNRLLSVIIIRL